MGGRSIVTLLLGLALCLPGANLAQAKGGGRGGRSARSERSGRGRGGRGERRGNYRNRYGNRRGRRGGANDPFVRLRAEESHRAMSQERSGRRGRGGRAGEERVRSELAQRLARSEQVNVGRAGEERVARQGELARGITRSVEERGSKTAARSNELARENQARSENRGRSRRRAQSRKQTRERETTAHIEDTGHSEDTARAQARAQREADRQVARAQRAADRAQRDHVRAKVRLAARDARDLVDVGEIAEAARVIGKLGNGKELGFRDRLTLNNARRKVLHAAYSMANRRSLAADIEGTVDALDAVSELSATGKLSKAALVKAWITENFRPGQHMVAFLDVKNQVFKNAMSVSIESRKYGDLETAAQQLDFADQLKPGTSKVRRHAGKLYKASLKFAEQAAAAGQAEQAYLALGVAEHVAPKAQVSKHDLAMDLNKALVHGAKKLRRARQHGEAAEMLARAELIQVETGIRPGFFLRRTQRHLTRVLGHRVAQARQTLADEMAQERAEAEAQAGGGADGDSAITAADGQ